MQQGVSGSYNALWWLLLVCSISAGFYFFREQKIRKALHKDLPKSTQAWERGILALYFLVSVCRLPLPFLAPLSLWCWGAVILVGFLSVWVSVSHVWQAVHASALMTSERFAEQEIAWPPSHFLYGVWIAGIVTVFFGSGGLIFEIQHPSFLSLGEVTLAYVAMGLMLAMIVGGRILISLWEKWAKKERENRASNK